MLAAKNDAHDAAAADADALYRSALGVKWRCQTISDEKDDASEKLHPLCKNQHDIRPISNYN